MSLDPAVFSDLKREVRKTKYRDFREVVRLAVYRIATRSETPAQAVASVRSTRPHLFDESQEWKFPRSFGE